MQYELCFAHQSNDLDGDGRRMERARLPTRCPPHLTSPVWHLSTSPAHGRRVGAAAPSDFGGFGAAAPVSPGAAKVFILVVLRKRRLTVTGAWPQPSGLSRIFDQGPDQPQQLLVLGAMPTAGKESADLDLRAAAAR